MKINITESKLTNVLNNYIKTLYPEFDNMDYTWASFNCGMGECCDMYAVGFYLPSYSLDFSIIKLVDSENYDDDGDYPEELQGELPEPCYEYPDITESRFDTILINEELGEKLVNFFGETKLWGDSFLKLFNQTYGTNANSIIAYY